LASGGAATTDPSLLSVVDAAAAGLTLTFDATTTADELADQTLDPNVAALATGIAVAGGGASAGDELVIVNAIRLRDPGVGDEWFREWRDSYDRAACGPAGGSSGDRNAVSTIAGHEVFIGACRNVVFTYHTRLHDGSIVVSLTSIGPSKLGARLLEHLAP
jgi:hypothetical protein